MRKISAKSAIRLLDTVAFLNYQHGVTLNGMVTLSFTQLGLTTAAEANAALVKLNEALADRLARFQAPRTGVDRRPFFFVYAHENVGTHGHHVHELLSLPDGAQAGLDDWLQKWARRMFGQGVDPRAVNFRGEYFYDMEKAIKQQVRLTRYILKSSEDVAIEERAGGYTTLHRLLNIDNQNYAYTANVRKTVGASQNLTRLAQYDVGYRPCRFVENTLTGKSLLEFHRQASATELQRQLRAMPV